MKRFYASLAVAVASLALAGTASAALITYQFDGTIDAVGLYDGAGIISDAGLSGGSAVSYTITIDADASAYTVRNNGSTDVYTDTSSYNYAYADLLSTLPIQEKNGGYRNGAWDYANMNYGYSASSGLTQVILGSGDSWLNLWRYNVSGSNNLTFSEWFPGATGFRAYNIAYSETGQYSSFYADLTLSSVTGQAQSSVPEPSTLFLLGSGISGLGVMRWRMRAKKA